MSKCKGDDKALSFIKDIGKDGLKDICLKLSKESMYLILSNIPFGGIAKTGIDYLLNAIHDN